MICRQWGVSHSILANTSKYEDFKKKPPMKTNAWMCTPKPTWLPNEDFKVATCIHLAAQAVNFRLQSVECAPRVVVQGQAGGHGPVESIWGLNGRAMGN